jgi:DNA-binding transcriptional LysR family regulator
MWYPNLRQLEIFRSLLQTRNVSETARRLNITQPAVSKVLALIEERLGVKLFNRHRGRLQTRREAERFAVEVERLLNQATAFNFGIGHLSGDDAALLKIAAIPTLSECSVALSIGKFSRKRPTTRFELHSQPAAQVLEYVQSHRVELGFVYGPVHGLSIERILVGQTEIVCAMHPSHRLAEREQLSPGELAGESLIFLEPASVPSYLLREIFEAHAVTPMPRVETNAFAIGRTLARVRTGIALIDKLVLEAEPSPEIVAVPFIPTMHLRIYCVHSSVMPPSDLANDFLEEMKRAIAEPPLFSCS